MLSYGGARWRVGEVEAVEKIGADRSGQMSSRVGEAEAVEKNGVDVSETSSIGSDLRCDGWR